MMLANEIIADIAKDNRFKAALEEMASSPLTEIGSLTVSTTFTANLDGGAKTVRVSIEMIDEGEMFADDLNN